VRGLVVANRLRVNALIALAMLNVFTLGAGIAVAGFLPARLALWKIPAVKAAPLASPGTALAPASSPDPLPTRQGLSAALGPLLASHSLGRHVGAVVTTLGTGGQLFSQDATSGFAPASSAKLLTAAAALSVLGPDARFTTKVMTGTASRSIVLVGGGDPTLAAGRPPAQDYPQPATLASLAAATARRLRAHGLSKVKLAYDASLFSGPAMAPGWTPSYVSTGNVTPISALEVDQGRLTPSGQPEDADNPGNYRPRSETPAADAAAAFASYLRGDGIRVTGQPVPGKPPSGGAAIAAVRSPVLPAIVDWMLRESNNVIAEDLARQVALRTGAAASFSGAAAAQERVLHRLGVVSGVHLVDGSGLSPRDRVSPGALAAVVKQAASPGHATLRPVITGMPVAGFSGTLAPGQSVFGTFGRAARGRIWAKTGNLNSVASLAGIADGAGGHLLVFAFMADRLPASQLAAAAHTIDALATALVKCGCR
jgi:D-alanyl-D-alanine carboxypeptidase/D-alanyl-D-alanine-endopeptidase (penicillin-binding protein 4)